MRFTYTTKLKHRGRGENRLGVLAQRLQHWPGCAERFEYVILAKAAFDRHGLALARPLAAGNIVGFAPERGSARGLSIALPPTRNDELHEVQAVMRLAAALDVREPPGALNVYAARERVAHWRDRMPALASANRTIALHISAREPSRMWPTERFISLARVLAADGVTVVLVWAPGAADDARHPGDDERAALIARGAPVWQARTESLGDLIAVLSLCQAFIGADGGAMHLAAGLRLPIVALFENLPSKKRRWHPWQVPYEMVCPETRDVADIPVEAVANAWERLAPSIWPR